LLATLPDARLASWAASAAVPARVDCHSGLARARGDEAAAAAADLAAAEFELQRQLARSYHKAGRFLKAQKAYHKAGFSLKNKLLSAAAALGIRL
jgi:hypothetical protein